MRFPGRWTGEASLVESHPRSSVKQIVMNGGLDWNVIYNFLTTYGPIHSLKIGTLKSEKDLKQLERITKTDSFKGHVELLHLDLDLCGFPGARVPQFLNRITEVMVKSDLMNLVHKERYIRDNFANQREESPCNWYLFFSRSQ